MKIVIIEDEPLIAKSLQSKLSKADDSIKVLTVLNSIEQCLEYVNTNNLPDLFFSDIQLLDGLSFVFFEQTEMNVPVVFCTAFDEYILKSLKTNGIDYILKPFKQEDINQAINKYKRLFEQTEDDTSKASISEESLSQLIRALKNSDAPKTGSILVQKGDQIIPVPYEDFSLFALEERVVFGYLKNDTNRVIVDQTLDDLIAKLPDSFVRANRQFVVHRTAILSASRYFGRKLKLQLSPTLSEHEVIISKANVTGFLNWLEGH